MQNGIKPPIRVVAEQLAKSNADAEPSVERIYLFPDEEEIRLVEIDTDFGSSEKVQPYYFGPQPIYGQPYPMAIALILPEQCQLQFQ